MIYFTPNELFFSALTFFFIGALGFIGSRALVYAFKGIALLGLIPLFMMISRERSSSLRKTIGSSIKQKSAAPAVLKDILRAVVILILGIAVTVLNYAIVDGVARIYSLLMLALGFFTAIKLARKPIDSVLDRLLLGVLFILTHTLNLVLFPLFFIAKILFGKFDKRNE